MTCLGMRDFGKISCLYATWRYLNSVFFGHQWVIDSKAKALPFIISVNDNANALSTKMLQQTILYLALFVREN